MENVRKLEEIGGIWIERGLFWGFTTDRRLKRTLCDRGAEGRHAYETLEKN